MHVAVFYAYVSEWNKLQPQNIKLNRKFNVWWNIKDFQSFTDLLASLQQENWKASEVKSDCVIHVCSRFARSYVYGLYSDGKVIFFLIVFALMPKNDSSIAIYI